MRKNIFLCLILFFLIKTGFALKPDTTYSWKPEIYGLMYKEYKVKTKDDYLLNVWFYPAQKSLSNDSMRYYFNKKTELRPFETSNDKKPTIIVCNGDAGNMAKLLSFAYIYSTNGFNVITFDWRGFGESQYFPIDTNYLVYSEFIDDYLAVIDFSSNIETVDDERIGVFGFSTGAFLSYVVANVHPKVKALVARAIFTDYKKTKNILRINDPNDTYLYPKEIDKFSPSNTWSNFSKPIFLIVGDLDEVTPKNNSIEIISNVKSNIRELWIVPNAKHGGVNAPEFIENKLFIDKSVRFFNENL